MTTTEEERLFNIRVGIPDKPSRDFTLFPGVVELKPTDRLEFIRFLGLCQILAFGFLKLGLHIAGVGKIDEGSGDQKGKPEPYGPPVLMGQHA